MDHAEARERLLDRAMEPTGLRGLATESTPEAATLRAHLATCDPCRKELEGWQGTLASLDLAVQADAAHQGAEPPSLRAFVNSVGEVTPPAALRARTLAAISTPNPSPVVRVDSTRRSVTWSARLAIAAAVVVLVGGAALMADRTVQLDRAQADAAALASVTATLNSILQDPDHHVAVLKNPAGASAGSVSWSAADGSVVVLTTALASPPPGHIYGCWIEQDGARVAVGMMVFSGSTAYWAGSLTSWGDGFAAGGRFWVNLEPADRSSRGTLVLDGTL